MDAKQFRQYIVKPTLIYLGDPRLNMENLLVGTACHESAGLKYVHQLGAGPALGLFQIEPATHKDQWDNYLAYRPHYHDLIYRLSSIRYLENGMPDDSELIGNIPYALSIAWCKYHRAPEAIPDAENFYGLANYWKRHYNTAGGAGTVDEWVSHYPH